MSVDYNKAATLLHIVDTAKQWPTLKGIHDLAMMELLAINVVALEDKAKIDTEVAKKAAEVQEKAAKERIEQAAKDKAAEEASNKAPPPPYSPAGHPTPARPI